MRYARAHKAETRERLVDAALRAFRDKGFDGTGINELMSSIGLTHGAFYAHFPSKGALLAETTDRGVAARTAGLRKLVASEPAPARAAALIDRYLSAAHLDNRADGCLLPALAAEVARQSPRVRRQFTVRFRELIDVVAHDITPHANAHGTSADAAAGALVLFSGMVGTMVLARAVDDRRLSLEMLDGMRDALRRLLIEPPPRTSRAGAHPRGALTPRRRRPTTQAHSARRR